MKKLVFFLCIVCMTTTVEAQEFIPLWKKGKMPNSRGLNLPDSIANERIYRVGTPGLYLFETSRAENKGAAVIIVPGGGYARLAYQISGFQLAKWFNTMGITAFVLQHRLPQSPDVKTCYKAPLQDIQRAVRYIRAHADRWGIEPQKIGVMGSSAGAHLSAPPLSLMIGVKQEIHSTKYLFVPILPFSYLRSFRWTKLPTRVAGKTYWGNTTHPNYGKNSRATSRSRLQLHRCLSFTP